MFDLTEHMQKFRKTTDFWRDESGTESCEVTAEECIAIKRIVKLGISLGLLSFAAQCEENLSFLLQHFYVSLNVKKAGFVGFPWIVGVVFIICSGNVDRFQLRLLAE